MRNPFKKDNTIEIQITKVLGRLDHVEPATEEYKALQKTLSTLTSLKELTTKSAISSDTLLVVLGNLAGVLIIVGYEHSHVLASKAMSTLLRPRS